MTDSPLNLKGPIAWMASNSVAANLGMFVLVLGGLYFAGNVKQEVMPEFQLELVTIAVPYPGASPEEVENGILLAVEEQVRGLEDVKEIFSTATEGSALVRAELQDSANPNKALQDIKNAVDRITSFPDDAERPVVQLVSMRRAVISLILLKPQINALYFCTSKMSP